MIIHQLSLGMMDNFCYIVGCEKTRDALVIDPGSGTEQILSLAQKDNLSIKIIFNTHHHWDHVACNAQLKAATGAKLVRHAAEDDILQGKFPGISGAGSGQPSPPADTRIEGDDTLQLGRITFQVLVS